MTAGREVRSHESSGRLCAGQRFLLALLLAWTCGLCGLWRVAGATTPSPADWRDLVLYQLLTDRFANGSVLNDALEGNYSPSDGFRNHGGDFAGVQTKLDYLQQLGMDGIWISPVVLNANAEYHGYAARDFFSIAPHFGTLAELQSLVAACHARGMVVVLDVVVNHMGDLIKSNDAGYPNYKYPATYNLAWRSTKHHAGFFDDLTKFHAHGNIGNFVDPEQILGELSGLDDLKTEDPAVRAQLTYACNWLIDQTDCDGFRIDTVKHVEMPFWQQWAPAIHAHCDSIGKSDFFLFGESFDGYDPQVGSYTGTVGGGPYKLDSMLWYPMFYTTNAVFQYAAPADSFTSPNQIVQRWNLLSNYDPTSRERLVSFLDNHDNSRFQAFGGPADADEGKARAAVGFQLTSRGVPCLYYGFEQGFDGGGDPYCREDMFRGSWDYGPSLGDNFDAAQPLAQYVRRLVEARRRHEALRKGATRAVHVTSTGAGPFLFERSTGTDTVWVLVNNSNDVATVNVPAAPWPAGTRLVDAANPDTVETVGGGGSTFAVRVPARAVRVYESLASRNAAAAAGGDRLHVTAQWPGHDASVADRTSPLRVAFDRDVTPEALEAAFTIMPFADGVWQVAGREARYWPRAAWTANVTYQWSFAASLAATDGTPLPARFDSRFIATAVATGVTVTAGFTCDRIARQALAAPTGIVAAPSLGPLTLLLTDTGKDRAYTLTTGGDLGHFTGDSRWSRPQGAAFDSAGRLLVVDDDGLYSIQSARMAARIAGGSSATTAGAVVWGSGPFGALPYLCDPAVNRVVRLNGGTLQTFATGINGAAGLAFGPGGAWGSDLYVADANLAAIGGAADGAGRIVRVTPAGAVSTFLADAALLNGAVSLAFAPAGAFSGHLYVADAINNRVLRISPAGDNAVFATGFSALRGPHCLAFGPDGALYVADAGSPQVVRIAPSALVTGVPAPEGRATLALVAAPNPFGQSTTLRFTLPAAGDVRLEILDVAGRVVRTLHRGALGVGEHPLVWDGRTNGGQPARAGVYLARLTTNDTTRLRRLALTR